MGHAFQNCRKIRPCRVCLFCCWFCFVFQVVLFRFSKGTICTLLSCLNTQQPDNLTCDVPLGGKGQIWLLMQMGKSNHSLVATAYSGWYIMHSWQCTKSRKHKKALSRTNSTHATEWISRRGRKRTPNPDLPAQALRKAHVSSENPLPRLRGLTFCLPWAKQNKAVGFKLLRGTLSFWCMHILAVTHLHWEGNSPVFLAVT